ncbi:phosphatase PAP2 family protein [Novosphingobium tardum]|uniref:Phosphatase PAP2 family protein n=1 Tax=Novosphingobium tardum TaxID=1538021 RepID=A0ABV8RMM0_9SPHN
MFPRLALGYWFLIALCVITLIISAQVGIEPASYYLSVSLTDKDVSVWIMPVLIWYLFVAVALVQRRVERPLQTLWRLTSRQKGWILRGTLFVFLSVPLGRAVMRVKVAIPNLVPFYADHFLIQADRALLGTDAWRLTHHLVGFAGTVVLDRLYGLWFMVMMGTLAWAAFTRDIRFQVRSLTAYFLTWFILGGVFATALSSVGPCFYDQFYGGNQFAPMMELLRGYDARYSLNALFSMHYLTAVFGKEEIGSGISAMPSLHVGIAFLLFLMCRSRFGMRWPRHVAFVYFVLIWFASVHLGWHYAVDGLASVFGVSAIWWGSGKFVRWLDARDARRLADEPKTEGIPSFAV